MSFTSTFLCQPVLRILGRAILWRLLLILVVVEAIFLAEEFTGLLQLALRLDGPLWVIGKMLVFRMPAIFDLALAFGLLIAVYFAVGDARSSGELVVLATAGIPWWRVVTLTLAIGTAGGALSLINAGYVLPVSNFAERVTVAELRKDYILDRIQTPNSGTALQTIEDTTFIATPPQKPDADQTGNLFVFQPDIGGFWRAATSRNWHVVAQDDNHHVIALQDLVAHDVPLTQNDGPILSRYAVAAADFEFDLSAVTPEVDRTRGRTEQILRLDKGEGQRVAKITSRALMVPLAGLLALAALVGPFNAITRLLALPMAAVLMLTLDVLANATVVGSVASLPPLLVALTAIALYLGPPLVFLARRKEDLMKPAERSV
ncbi:MAG: LptF/LptG family permease [Shimia sp.]|uniref:LptF/LptG family permease n=1 Tax=Shimia sp. TaxID=1954381 RepID=UPI00405949B7